MFRCRYGWRLFTSVSASSKSSWDPTVSLTLSHPTLVLLEKCRTRNHFKQILAQMIRIRLVTETFPMSRLLLFSAVSYPENLDIATILFDHYTPRPNLFIYNTMISALSFSSTQTFSLYNSMLRSYLSPDEKTLISLIKGSNYLSEVKQIHCHAIVTGLSSCGYFLNSLIKMYSEHGQMALADQVFQQVPQLDTISFNIMIAGYVWNSCSLKALDLFLDMVSAGLSPDDFTMVSLLMSCGRLRNIHLGNSVHAWILRRTVCGLSLVLSNAVLDMYAKCGNLVLARRVFDASPKKDIVSWNTVIAGYVKIGEVEIAHGLFDEMPVRDLVSWNSIIAGYAQRGNLPSLMDMFNGMIFQKVVPDKFTIVSLVCSAAKTSSLGQGRWVHGWIVRRQMKLDAFLGSALVDMYCKCGGIEAALAVFKMVTVKDVTLWTSMIAGFGSHGYGKQALEYFCKMQENLKPNQVTFVAILTACSHSGMVDEGLRIFNTMKENYGIEPGVEHYGCLIDLLARAGKLSEAKRVIDNMTMKPSRSIWGAMLNASQAHGNVEMAEAASMELLKLEPEKEGGYILLSNMYAADGNWGDSNRIREIMGNRGLKKTAGCSKLVVGGRER
ncbi:hypothetical protein MKX03_003779 [Papaver bracteatum]|nr:hypothetical protein MKX03_003779 [Papaver bracteatum]